MGFLARSVSMMRYTVRGEIVGSFWDEIHEGVKRCAFKQIESPGEVVGMGWVSMEDFTDNEFVRATYVFGKYVAIALRIDTIRVPPRILEINVRNEEKKILEETGRRRLGSAQRRELRDRVKEVMKKQSLPSIQVLDLVWDTSKGVAYFASLSSKARECVEDHFKKTFNLSLVPLIPYIRAGQLLEHSVGSSVLDNIRPATMAP